VIAALLLAPLLAAPAQGPGIEPGRFLWLGVWPNRILVFDTAKDEVVGSIPLRKGVAFDFTLTRDRKRLFVSTDRMEGFEIVDVPRREVVDDFRLSTDERIVRLDDIVELPGGKRVLLSVTPVKKEIDRYAIEKKEVWLFDLEKREKVKSWKEKDLPREIRRARLLLSPDGTALHAFGRDLVVVDPEEMKVKEKLIELAKPLFAGLGPFRPMGGDLFDYRDPDRYTVLYRSRDPIRKKNATGLLVLDLKGKKVADFGEIGPEFPGFRPAVSPDRKKAFAYGNEHLHEIDLVARRIVRQKELKLEPRRWLTGVSVDGKRLYVGGAGERWDVYSTESLEKLRTVEFPGDITSGPIAVESGPL
jgi:hypothetical protein